MNNKVKKTIHLFIKVSNMLFIPSMMGVVCIIVFREELNQLSYGMILRWILLAMCSIVVVGNVLKFKK